MFYTGGCLKVSLVAKAKLPPEIELNFSVVTSTRLEFLYLFHVCL